MRLLFIWIDITGTACDKNNPTLTGGEMGEIKRCYCFSVAHHAPNHLMIQTPLPSNSPATIRKLHIILEIF